MNSLTKRKLNRFNLYGCAKINSQIIAVLKEKGIDNIITFSQLSQELRFHRYSERFRGYSLLLPHPNPLPQERERKGGMHD